MKQTPRKIVDDGEDIRAKDVTALLADLKVLIREIIHKNLSFNAQVRLVVFFSSYSNKTRWNINPVCAVFYNLIIFE